MNGRNIYSIQDAITDYAAMRKWTDPHVLRKRNIVLGNDRAAAKEFFLKWRTTAVEVAISAF